MKESQVAQVTDFSGDEGRVQLCGYGGSAYCAVVESPTRLGDSTTVAVRCWQRGRPADSMFALLDQA